MTTVDHIQAATDAANGLEHPLTGSARRNLCRAYLEKAGEVTALRERLREVLGRVDDLVLDLDDEERGVPTTEAAEGCTRSGLRCF